MKERDKGERKVGQQSTYNEGEKARDRRRQIGRDRVGNSKRERETQRGK